MALLLFQEVRTRTEGTMNTHTATSDDDTTQFPETAGEGEDLTDMRQLTPEADDCDPEEAGYGYGV
jgi:hypothetical protein